ncbi:MAG: tol-pal system protein YbgF [Deltaproteobacteria bacterium]|nr:tol-pal system protein YbgF [Deltaproteobacteria bacterium]
MLKPRLKIGLLVVSLGMLSGCMVTFQDLYGVRDSLQTQISSIETDLDQIRNGETQKQSTEVEKAKAMRVEVDVLRTMLADLTTSMEQLKSDLNEVRGRQADLGAELEGIRSQGRLDSGDMEKKVLLLERELTEKDRIIDPSRIDRLESEADGIRRRIETIEATLGATGKEKQQPQPPVAPKAPPVETEPPKPQASAPEPPAPQASEEAVATDPDQLYKAATAAYKKGQYSKSRTLFAEFTGKYPNHPIADNAQFWVGETYYKEGKFEDAILEYQKVIQRYGTGNKVPDALLKQALSFKQLGDKTSAKILLQKLIKDHSESGQAQVAFGELRKME